MLFVLADGVFQDADPRSRPSRSRDHEMVVVPRRAPLRDVSTTRSGSSRRSTRSSRITPRSPSRPTRRRTPPARAPRAPTRRTSAPRRRPACAAPNRAASRAAHRRHERAAAGREHAIDVARGDARAREHVVEHAIDRVEVVGDPRLEARARRSADRARSRRARRRSSSRADSRTFAPSTARCSTQPEIVLDDAHEPPIRAGSSAPVRDAIEQPQRRRLLEERQVVPAPQVPVEPRRHRRLAADLVAVAACRARAPARRSRRSRARRTRRPRRRCRRSRAPSPRLGPTRITREVGRAAAEVGHHDQLVVIEPRRVARRRADRLVLEHDLVEPGLAERVAHPRRPRARRRRRPRRPSSAPAGRSRSASPRSTGDAARSCRRYAAIMSSSCQRRPKIVRPRERRARQVRLDRLHEAALALGLEVARDRRARPPSARRPARSTAPSASTARRRAAPAARRRRRPRSPPRSWSSRSRCRRSP